MLGKPIKLFKLFGFDIKIDLSWIFIVLLITWSLATGYFPYKVRNLSQTSYWYMGMAGAVGLFASILFHELGTLCGGQEIRDTHQRRHLISLWRRFGDGRGTAHCELRILDGHYGTSSQFLDCARLLSGVHLRLPARLADSIDAGFVLPELDERSARGF